MDHERGAAVPAAHEADEFGDMLFARRDIAVERRGNVVQPQPQMVFRRDRGRPFDAGFIAEQRHDMARAGILDGLMQA